MAKRSTIGENPLDAPVADNPLDTVLPGAGMANRTARVEERLDLLEAGLAGLQAEAARAKRLGPEISFDAAQLKTEMASLKGEMARLQASWPLLQAEIAPLKAEVAGLKTELEQLRAKITPADIPWWLGGRKK